MVDIQCLSYNFEQELLLMELIKKNYEADTLTESTLKCPKKDSQSDSIAGAACYIAIVNAIKSPTTTVSDSTISA